MAEYTPMMRQYLEIKEQNRDSIVLYRLGDFYEMFFDDAKVVSKELDLVLTGRDCGAEERAPMCGVPYHSVEGYISRLVQKGYKVSICEQVEDPKVAKGIVKREIVRTISKGTIIEQSMLSEEKNNYICAVFMDDRGVGLCFSDMSTGETVAASSCQDGFFQWAINEVSRFSPSECVLCNYAYTLDEFCSILLEKQGVSVYPIKEEYFEHESAIEIVDRQFSISAMAENSYAVTAAGALMAHLHETQKNDLSYLNKLSFYKSESYMSIDLNAKRNLELVSSLRSGDKSDTLLSVLDHTKTAMGSRLIKKWIINPLIDRVQIDSRLWAVKNLVDDIMVRDKLTTILKDTYDIERIISRVSYGTANCRDLKALSSVCSGLPHLKSILEGCSSALLKSTARNIDLLTDMYDAIESSIVESPPFSVREGGMIKAGFNEQVDYLNGLIHNSNGKLAQIEQNEREATGIKTLKVGFNKVFGYYIEISKGASAQAPLHYVRKQTLSNCERYITDELKILEGEILAAGDKSVALEYQLFCEVRDEIAKNTHRFQQTAQAIAVCDVLLSFATAASKYGYTMPEVGDNDRLDIVDGRHPVVERVLKDAMFVPNNTLLDCNENRMAIITGPNMAGKSTYMKQVALIVIMAQCGSFVPAQSAYVGVCDKIFTRVGASDDLAGGRSTFMVEMTEVADILKNATAKSLIILDEIGRGTSTYDGMSIARAVLEYAANKKHLGAKTMFATHYHELTELEHSVEGVKNYNIAVKKRGKDIIFIKKIIPGGADDSYGVEVARLAGLPEKVTDRAEKILEQLENGDKTPKAPIKVKSDGQEQLSFGDNKNQEIIDKLKAISPEVLSPIEAMNVLYELCKKAKM